MVEHFHRLSENVPYVQANFMFGLDSDRGDDPTELTKRFMDRTPFVWPAINIPVHSAAPRSNEGLLAGDRILRAMPFGFYYAPYLVTTLQNYDPVTYYGQLVGLFEHAASPSMLRRADRQHAPPDDQAHPRGEDRRIRATMNACRRIHGLLRSDAQFRAFHEGRSDALPASTTTCTTGC